MGREIEIKIPLSDAEYGRLLDFFKSGQGVAGVCIQQGSIIERILKSDEYYSRYKSREESRASGEPQVCHQV